MLVRWHPVLLLFCCTIKRMTRSEEAVIKWTINCKTGNTRFANSDANQRIVFHGTLRDSATINLDENDSKTRFQKNSSDSFQVTTRDIGKLLRVTLWNDNSGIAPIWLMSQMRIIDNNRNRIYEVTNKVVNPKKTSHGVNGRYSVVFLYSVIYEVANKLVNPQKTLHGVDVIAMPTTTTTTTTTTTSTTELSTNQVSTEGSTMLWETTTDYGVETSSSQPSTTEYFDNTTKVKMCLCKCGPPKVNRTQEEVKKYFKELKKELIMPKKNTSSYLRKKISVPDNRVSAQATGYVGMVLMIFPFAVIVGTDLVGLAYYISTRNKDRSTAMESTTEAQEMESAI